jgi:hypothetical protein
MPNNQNSARPLAPQGARIALAQLAARAEDHKARGGNPVTVSDLKQRHGIGNTAGRPLLSTLLFGRD